jgi:hypothetical protein
MNSFLRLLLTLSYSLYSQTHIISPVLPLTMSSAYLESLFGLQGKTALCTGASRGIGAKMAEAVAKAGADVLLVQVSG